ncbi:hypothetical protein BG004_000421 [Podila humilis]|nr:hypothetical protein BG004_000421 [Podila humilis]
MMHARTPSSHSTRFVSQVDAMISDKPLPSTPRHDTQHRYQTIEEKYKGKEKTKISKWDLSPSQFPRTEGQSSYRSNHEKLVDKDEIYDKLSSSSMVQSGQRRYQRFKDKDSGRYMVSLPTQLHQQLNPGQETSNNGNQYVFWSDIKRAFPNVSYLQDVAGRVLFVVDQQYKVCTPLRILYSKTAYTVITKDCEILHADSLSEEHCTSPLSNRHNQYGTPSASGSIRSAISDYTYYSGAATSRSSSVSSSTSSLSTINSTQLAIDEVTRHYRAYKDLHRTLAYIKASHRHHFLQIMANMEYQQQMLQQRIDQHGILSSCSSSEQKEINRMLNEIQVQNHYACQLDIFNRCNTAIKSAHRQLELASPRLFLVLPDVTPTVNHRQSMENTHFRLYFLCDFNYRQAMSPWNQYQITSCGTASPQHIHITNHPGYEIDRPREFFSNFGHYALTVLEMVSNGFQDDIFFVPPIESMEILNVPGAKDHSEARQYHQHHHSHLSQNNIRPLVNRAIAYLRDLFPTRQVWTQWLSVSQTRRISSFLKLTVPDIQGMGGLHRTSYKSDAIWLCKGHAQYQAKVLPLYSFIRSHHATADLQFGKVNITVSSPTMANQLTTMLCDSGCVYDLSIRFGWEPSRTFLAEFLRKLAASPVRILELEGITTEIHPQQQWTQNDTQHDVFLDLITSTSLELVILRDYPHPSSQCMYLEPIKDCRYRFQARMSAKNTRPEIAWERLFQDLHYFENAVLITPPSAPLLYSSSSRSHIQRPYQPFSHSQIASAMANLTRKLHAHGAGSTLTSIDLYDEDTNTWQARLGISSSHGKADGDSTVHGVTETFIPNDFLRPEILDYGSLQQLIVKTGDPALVPYLYTLMERNQKLEKLEIEMREDALFRHTAELGEKWSTFGMKDERSIDDIHGGAKELCVKLFDHVPGQRNRNLIAMLLVRGGQHHAQDQQRRDHITSRAEFISPATLIPPPPVVTKVLEWHCDHVPTVGTDQDALLLDLATQVSPSMMTSFVLDISSMTPTMFGSLQLGVGFAAVQQVLERSRLEILHVRCCTPITPVNRQAIREVLRAVQWTTIKCLALSGNHLDDWIQLWADANEGGLSDPLAGPKLLTCLDVRGTEVAMSTEKDTESNGDSNNSSNNENVHQILSHASVLGLHELVYSNPLLVEVWFDNFRLKSTQEWELIVEALEETRLMMLGLPRAEVFSQDLLDRIVGPWHNMKEYDSYETREEEKQDWEKWLVERTESKHNRPESRSGRVRKRDRLAQGCKQM